MIIDIAKEEVPYRFEIEISGKTYGFEINYNSSNDFFTLDLSKNGIVQIVGERVLYGKELFIDYPHIDAPRGIVPKDLAGNETRVTYDNLGETVFLFVGEEYE